MSVRSTSFLALLCCALAACDGGTSGVQVITGRVDASKGALAIRAVADDDIVTATPVRTDGSFTLTLPAGPTYRLEVLTQTGVKNIVQRSGNILRDLSFTVCQPTDPFDVGGVGDPDPSGLCMPGDPNCEPCDPMTGTMCEQPLPPTCDPMLDPNCKCDVVLPDGTCCTAGDPSCGPLPCMDPDEPSCCDANGFCPPTPCDPTTDPMCEPPSCEPGDPNCCVPDMNGGCEPPQPCDPTDPMCKCNADGTCPPLPCMDPSDPNCGGCTDPSAPGCTPPCEDAMDPTTCKDPCIADPASCGCMVEADGTANCWPAPQPCCDDSGTTCDPGDGMAPDNVPGDFGCEGN